MVSGVIINKVCCFRAQQAVLKEAFSPQSDDKLQQFGEKSMSQGKLSLSPLQHTTQIHHVGPAEAALP